MFTFTQKVQTVGTISQFMNKQTEVQAELLPKKPMTRLQTATVMTANLTAVGLTTALFGSSTPVMAAGVDTKTNVSSTVMHGFQPIIDLISGFSYPITFLVFATAGITWVWNREKAIKLMQGGVMSFCLVQLTPMIMKILVSVASGF